MADSWSLGPFVSYGLRDGTWLSAAEGGAQTGHPEAALRAGL